MNATDLIKNIPESEKTPLVITLLEINQQYAEEIQLLKDEIARLKGQKPKPKIKPSNLVKNTDKKKSKKNKSRKKKKFKTKNLHIHEDKEIHPENIPDKSTFIDYHDYFVQDILIFNWNTRFRLGRWQTPPGDFITGKLPNHINGHFGPGLKSFILYQHYNNHVTQPLIYEQLWELQVDISAGTINNIIIEKKDCFHNEKAEILIAGLSESSHINVDDTGARHKGKNGYCTHIGNEYFAWFESTESKSRINFLKLLRGDHKDFIISYDALEYMSVQGLPQYQIDKLVKIKNTIFNDKGEWDALLISENIVTQNHVRIATEGSLVGSIIYHGFNKDMAIISDDAGQFNVFLHGLCWVHAERTIHKLIGFTEQHKKILEEIRKDIWQLYRDLKDYRDDPDEAKKNELKARFDELFTRKTGYATLEQALKRIHKNKSELLLVLERPDIPLHNNLSESDIREYVKRRKISGSTRSDTGRKCRDTFVSLKKTCRKLGISFWDYLNDRISRNNQIPPLADIMRTKISESVA